MCLGGGNLGRIHMLGQHAAFVSGLNTGAGQLKIAAP